jgi:hypothetical protein
MMFHLSGLGLGESTSPGWIEQQDGLNRLNAARALVSADYCRRLACGVIQQNEAGMEKVQACGLAYPQQPMGWCSDTCSPYITELKTRYGRSICGPIPAPVPQAPPPPQSAPVRVFKPLDAPLPAAPAPRLVENPLPTIVQPTPPVPVQALPAPLRPTSTTFISEVDCPSCQTPGCTLRIGDCCLTTPQLLVLAAILVLGVVTN